MCGHVSTSIAADTCPCVVGYSGNVISPPPPQEQFPPLQLLVSHHELMIASELDFSDDSAVMFGFSGGSGSGCGCDSPSSRGSGGGGGGEHSVMQRSVSSNDGFFGHFASAHGLTLESEPVRRALSAGDLHRKNKQQGRRGESELWSESNAIIQGMNRTVRYSPQEKKERIERYRTKRNLRNFNKRIKYECRKTLADSRPRIRGRFARNDEIEDIINTNNISQVHAVEGNQEHVDTWSSFLDSFSVNHFLNL